MPTYRTGDMFDAPGIHIVTASASISQDDTLVMGLGAAYAMKRKHPQAPKLFGAMVREYCGEGGVFGFLFFGSIGILQTRLHYNGKSDAALITYGLNILRVIAEGQPGIVFNLTHPGVVFGKTKVPEVEAVLDTLPANVVVWER